jgi:hypothetical protein
MMLGSCLECICFKAFVCGDGTSERYDALITGGLTQMSIDEEGL